MNKKGDYLMFKKLLCGVVAMTMVLGLASCDKTQKETKVSGDEVLGLVMTDMMSWDMTKGIEIDGSVNTKLGNYTKAGDFNFKFALNPTTGSLSAVQIHLDNALGSSFDAYIDQTASYICIDDFKLMVPATTQSDDGITIVPLETNSSTSDPMSDLVEQFDFYKVSDTKYYMTAKTEFIELLNLQIATVLANSLPFLGLNFKELRIDFNLTKDQKLNGVGLKTVVALSIDNETLNCEFNGNISINKENAMPTIPTDASSYMTVEQFMQQLVQTPLTGSVELDVQVGELQAVLAADISYTLDVTTGYPNISIDINDKTTIDIMALLGATGVTLKKITIAYDEETLGMALNLYDDQNQLIMSVPFSSSTNTPSDNPSDTPLASSGSESQETTTTIDMVFVKEILKAILFDFTIVENDDNITITFNSQLWNVIKNYAQEALETYFGGDIAQVIQQLETANEAIKAQNPDTYEQDANYQSNLRMIQLLTILNNILSIETAQVVINLEYTETSTTLVLSVISGNDSIQLTISVDQTLIMLTLFSVGLSTWVIGSSTNTPSISVA